MAKQLVEAETGIHRDTGGGWRVFRASIYSVCINVYDPASDFLSHGLPGGSPQIKGRTRHPESSVSPSRFTVSSFKALFTHYKRRGTKNYEFYVSDDGRNFGQPVKKGAFEPGREEKIETFEPIKCRFIKLKAISEINGLPWTSAAEIRVIPSGEDVSVKDYWRGNIGQTNWDAIARHDSAKPDAIDSFVAALSADGWLWENGIDAIRVTQATTPEEVVSETLRMAKFKAGLITSYQILNIREVHIPDTCTAVLVDTNLGRMIVLMQYVKEKGSTPRYWWRRIYDANPPIKRLY